MFTFIALFLLFIVVLPGFYALLRKCDRYGAEPDYCRGTGVLGNCSRLDVVEDKRELKIS